MKSNYRLMLHVFIIACIFRLAASCPANASEILPCTCREIGRHSSTVTCSNVNNERELQNAAFHLRNTTIEQFEVFDSNFNFLPGPVFRELRIKSLFLAGSSFVALTDTDIAFAGLENTLERFKIAQCTLFSGWNWSHLRKLAKLSEIEIRHGDLESIEEDISDIGHLGIRNLQLIDSDISWVHEKAFANFSQLSVLSLMRNEISTLKRSMFPDPAPLLLNLLFSGNRLEYLPNDLFARMPKLISIFLDYNPILTINEKTFGIVWDNLNSISLRGSKLHCDCRLRWLLSRKFPKNTFANCHHPPSLRGRDIKKLTGVNLVC